MAKRVLSLFLVASLVTLGACGFQLRGAYQVPSNLRTLHLVGETPASPIVSHLRRSMLSSGVTLVDNQTEAPYTLYVSRERSEKRSLSVDSLAAAAEFQLRQFASFEIRDQADQLVLGPHELITERNFQNDINNVVGKRDEERLIRQEMHAQLARQIMRRYQSIDPAQLNQANSLSSGSPR